MKISCLSDPHILSKNPRSRLDDASATSIEKFEFVLKWCSKNESILLISGDLTDKPRSWKIYNKLVELFKKYNDVNVYCVYGQHDQYYRSREATMLDLLNKNGLVKLLTDKPILNAIDNVQIYGANWNDEIPDFKTNDSGVISILVIHAPISNEALWSTQQYIDAKDLVDELDFDLIFCGDIHRKFKITKDSKTIINSGPMIRKEATEYNILHKPGFWIVDETFKIDWIEIPHVESSEVLTRDVIETENHTNELMSKFTESLKSVEVKDLNKFENLIDKYFKENEIKEEVKEIIINEIEGLLE